MPIETILSAASSSQASRRAPPSLSLPRQAEGRQADRQLRLVLRARKPVAQSS